MLHCAARDDAVEMMTEREKKLEFEALYTAQFRTLFAHGCTRLHGMGVPPAVAELYAQEAVQETFAALWERKDEILGREYRMAWLNSVLHNKLADLLREERSWQEVLNLLRGQLPQEDICPMEETELLICLEQSLPPEEYRLLYRLYVKQERPSDLCNELGIKSSALSMRLRRVKEKVRKIGKIHDHL